MIRLKKGGEPRSTPRTSIGIWRNARELDRRKRKRMKPTGNSKRKSLPNCRGERKRSRERKRNGERRKKKHKKGSSLSASWKCMKKWRPKKSRSKLN